MYKNEIHIWKYKGYNVEMIIHSKKKICTYEWNDMWQKHKGESASLLGAWDKAREEIDYVEVLINK